MIRHLVLFRVAGDDPAGVCRDLATNLAQLGGLVPGIRGWQHGANVTPDAQAAHYALVADFPGHRELEAYFEHPDHLALVARFEGRVELSFVDLEW